MTRDDPNRVQEGVKWQTDTIVMRTKVAAAAVS
jgi:hypothetical protein